MPTVLPSRIMNYKVTAASPTDELVTLGQIFSEVGDYASSVLDNDHLSFTRKCASRLKRVVEELMARRCIQSAEDLYEMPERSPGEFCLTEMSIGELHNLYRRWPIRHRERAAKGREHNTFYLEGRILREMLQRKPANKGEQLKIDYCAATYSNELENLSLISSLPVKLDENKIYPDYKRHYTLEELAALISLYEGYRDIAEREILIEYVDFALDLLEKEVYSFASFRLLGQLADLGCKKVINIPDWVNSSFEKAVACGIGNQN